MDRLSWCGVLCVLAVGCGPAVVLDESSSGSSGASSTSAAMDEGGPSVPPPTTSTPPSPSTTSPVTTSPVTTSPPPPSECVPGDVQACSCPNGFSSEQRCEADGFYGPCDCNFGTTGWGSSTGSWVGSGSTGEPGGPIIPPLPPGEVCLPLDMPCQMFGRVTSDAELALFETCSRMATHLIIVEPVSSLEPLGCLRQVQQDIGVVGVPVQTLSDLSLVETVGGLVVFDAPELISYSMPNLSSAEQFVSFDNPQLSSFDLPNLTEVGSMEVYGNPLLPDCAVAALAKQSSPIDLMCQDNLEDMCSGVCM